MWIYIINIALILYWWLIYSLLNSAKLRTKLHIGTQTNEPSIRENVVKNTLLFLPFLQLYLMLSLKSYNVGTDTYQYSLGFKEIIYYTDWQDIFNFQIENVVFGFERGFILLSKSITILVENYSVYLAVLYVLMIFPLYLLVKKHSVMPFLSLILFIAFGYLNFYSSGIRQAIAISIAILSYDYIVKRKFWKFLCVVTIAALIHKSAIVFLPAYFLMTLTFTPVVATIYFLSITVIYVFRFSILGFFTQRFYPGVVIGNTGSYTLLLVVLTTFIAGMFSYKKVIAMNKNNKLIYNLIAIAVVLMIANTAIHVGVRIAHYYYIFMILFIPNIITSYKDSFIRHISVVVVVIFTMTYYFRIGVNQLNGNPYTFFWQ